MNDLSKYIIGKILRAAALMLIVSILIFLAVRLIPGDSAQVILRSRGIEPAAETVENYREELGLNRPLAEQYIYWLIGVFRGDLGYSYITNRPVIVELIYRLPATLELTLAGTAMMLILSVPAGIISAFYRSRIPDHAGRLLSLLGASIPGFWLGLLLIYFFAMNSSWLPVGGRGSWQHLLLPSFALGAGMAASYSRLLRASLLETLGEDYIRVSRSKGLSEKMVICKHALKNALIPVVSSFGVTFGHLLGGTVVIEKVFNWPGLGRFAVEAIFSRDYPVIQAYVLIMALIFLLVNFLVDLSYRILDPRTGSQEDHGL